MSGVATTARAKSKHLDNMEVRAFRGPSILSRLPGTGYIDSSFGSPVVHRPGQATETESLRAPLATRYRTPDSTLLPIRNRETLHLTPAHKRGIGIISPPLA